MNGPAAITASACHAAACAAVHAAAFPANQAWSAAAFAGLLGSPGVQGLLAAEGCVVLIRQAADEAEILTLATAPPCRRRGIARALLSAALALMQKNGATRAFLEVSADNIAARALYAAAGFSPCGRRQHYYPDGADAIVLQCVLVPPAG